MLLQPWERSQKTPRLPGLNIKLPFIQSSHLFSVRTQVVPEKFSTLTKDLQVIEATATVKFAVKPNEAPRIYSTIASSDASIYGRVIQPSLLKSLKSVFSKFDRLEHNLDLSRKERGKRAQQIRLCGGHWILQALKLQEYRYNKSCPSYS